MFPKKEKEKNKVNLKKGSIHRELIINFIEDSNIYALKIMYHLTRYDLDLNMQKNGPIVSLHLDTKFLENSCSLDYINLKRNLQKIMKTQVSLSSRNDEYVQIIPRMKITPKKLILDMYIDVFEMLTDNFSNFIKLNNIDKMMLLKKDHSVRLFAYLQQLLHNRKAGIDDFGKKTFSLEELNGFFGTKYKNIAEINLNIIKNIYDEVNNIIPFEYELVKSSSLGRPKNIGISFKPLTPVEISIRATPTIILPNPSDKDNSELRNKFKFNK